LGSAFNVQILKKEKKMKKILLALFITSPLIWAEEGSMNMHHHSHEGHLHDKMVDGKNLEVNAERFDKFMEGIVDMNIAIVSVQGMVCDFCARGIEKAFLKDSNVDKIDVDLDSGKVIIAYVKSKEIDPDAIKKMILMNGQNMTNLQIIKI